MMRRFNLPHVARNVSRIGFVTLLAFSAALPRAPSSAPTRAATEAQVTSVAAVGTQFRMTLTDGRVLRSPELAGTELTIATDAGTTTIRIEAVERDSGANAEGVWLHTMLLVRPDGSTQNLCDAGPDGRRQGFPLASRLAPDGHIIFTQPEQFELVCTAGARGKCVRFGYRPWKSAEQALYEACTRMVRADYCGNAVATTRN